MTRLRRWARWCTRLEAPTFPLVVLSLVGSVVFGLPAVEVPEAWAGAPTDAMRDFFGAAKPLVFGTSPPRAPLGSWTLLDPGTMLAAPRCTNPFPNGEVHFVEDRSGPPSRSYLKLWEALSLIGRRPGRGETCLDLGSSPGGWSWALQQIGARVISVDKAPLAPEIARIPSVEHRQESAFALDPHTVGPVDWLFSDIVCYPARLLTLVERWLAAGTCRNFVCTIKFQGPTDHETARRFAAIPGSQLHHLFHNKHELTWSKIG